MCGNLAGEAASLKDLIHYEFPLNERIRLLVRLEQLFSQLDYFRQGVTVWDVRASVSVLIQLVELSNRSDLRSEVMQELDRQTTALNRMSGLQSGVDHRMLGQTIEHLETLNKNLFSEPGKPGLSLMEDDLFKSLVQRSNLPGGVTSFDIPAYHFWLEGSSERRSLQVNQWVRSFQPVRDAVEAVMNFIRTSALPAREESISGFYQKSLDHTLPYQMIRISLPKSSLCYAEISGGRHRFTVRFMQKDANGRSVQITDDVSFHLTCCLF